jgi:hypothetical protein
MSSYIFRLEKFHIDNTRALHNDTDTVTFSLKVGDQQLLTKSKGMGDVNNGDHSIGLQFGPVSIDSSTPVVLSFLIVNSGYPGSHEGDTNSVLNLLSDASDKVASALYPLGPVWPVVNKIVHELNTLLFADCDGPVAGDRIPGPQAADQIPANTLTGTDLDRLIASGGDTFSLTRSYAGTDSPDGCGSNSKYTVTWSVRPTIGAPMTNVAPTAVGAGNNIACFAVSPDGRIFYSYAQLGQGGHGWKEVDGGGRTDAAPSAGAIGTYVFVIVKGLDGKLYLNQGELGKGFIGWLPMM